MRTKGEPLGKGRLDPRAAEARALHSTLLGVALFSGVILVNGILAILFIALMQALGLWGPATSEAASLDEIRPSLQALVHRSSASSA